MKCFLMKLLQKVFEVDSYISSAIPKALFSIGVNAPAGLARLQRPSHNPPELSSKLETLQRKLIHSTCFREKIL